MYLTKSFSVARYGSKENARQEATKFRDKYYKLIYRTFQEEYIRENVNYRELERGGKIYRYYRAVYYDAVGNLHEKSFNIDKLGRDKALEKAKECADIGRRWDLIKTYAIENDSTK